jgi:hypothetical protein
MIVLRRIDDSKKMARRTWRGSMEPARSAQGRNSPRTSVRQADCGAKEPMRTFDPLEGPGRGYFEDESEWSRESRAKIAGDSSSRVYFAI